MSVWRRNRWLPRGVAAALVLLGAPLLLSLSAFLQDAPIRPDEPSPRTVIAPDLIRVTDPERTERARREAASAVPPVLVDVQDARVAIPQVVRDAFTAAEDVREPAADADDEDDADAPPSRREQISSLRPRLTMLEEDGLRVLTGLSAAELQRTSDQAESIAVDFADQRIAPDDLDDARTDRLRSALALRSWPPDVAELVVEPIIAEALRPTVSEDQEATEEAREEAASAVEEVAQTFTRGQTIVVAGQQVETLQYAALRARGLEGAEPWLVLVRSLALIGALFVVVAAYLRSYRPDLWRSTRRMTLLAVLAVLFVATLEAVTLTAPTTQGMWLLLVPIGALAMLATILFEPPIAVLMTIPAVATIAFAVPGDAGMIAFATLAALISIPLVSRLSARGALRRAAVQSTLAYAVLAALTTAIFDSVDINVVWAAGAGALNGVLTAVIVNGSLPFLESIFGVLTATSLQDLADRNHPMMRELEQKALGTYNHSVMVSSLVERACRAIDADALLGSVLALYHDIGKVKRPYFFVENQFAIDNPHDALEPEVSAQIIKAHVVDGQELGRELRLPPEVIDGISTHHGTTLVSYFHRKALKAADDAASVDEDTFRYLGPRPSTKEQAILMLADSCEGASRAAAMADRTMGRDRLEAIIRGLVEERIEDGQLEQASLTFRELSLVQDAFVETLIGVYHPRIAYPAKPGQPESAAVVAPSAPAPAGPTPPTPVDDAGPARPGAAARDGAPLAFPAGGANREDEALTAANGRVRKGGSKRGGRDRQRGGSGSDIPTPRERTRSRPRWPS